MKKVKTLGQVYTPVDIVRDVLDAAGYIGTDILGKHVMENSFGEGAFLSEIVTRYIHESKKQNHSNEQIAEELATYVHGIDIDPANLSHTVQMLNEQIKKEGIIQVNWDLSCRDSLTVVEYDNKMDYVVGNPPYVRVHNLNDSYDAVKRFSFAQDGMTDIYIVFFEIGLNMLKKGGKLSYITANSYYSSLAGTELRKYIRKTRSLYKIMDLGHYNPFNETTYTTITAIQKETSFDSVYYMSYELDTGRPVEKDSIPYTELFVDSYIVLLDGAKNRSDFSKIYSIDRKKHSEISVKNGFATLSDKVFIGDHVPDSKQTIRAIKASTGKWTKCIYPYDENGHLIPFDKLDPVIQTYFESHSEELGGRDVEKNAQWYAYGRSQAIADVQKTRIAVNALVKDISSLKIQIVNPGEGIYSGIYILSEKYTFEQIESVLKTNDFMTYVRGIYKCKSGGYFTYSTEDLNKYLIYKLGNSSSVQTKLFNYS